MIAVTRDVSPSVAMCELSHIARAPVDYEVARRQHEEYRALLASLGWTVFSLPADSALPDCVFVEDTAVVLPELAIITRPGAESRRAETDAVAGLLQRWRPLQFIEPPGTLDGGDVLVLGDRIFVGRSERSNEEGREQLQRLSGREVIPVALSGCLHLKTAITQVSAAQLLVNRDWVDVSPFRGWELIDIEPEEPFGANALLAGETVVYPAGFPKTRRLLEAATIHVFTVEADELAKAEGGVTCCAILVG